MPVYAFVGRADQRWPAGAGQCDQRAGGRGAAGQGEAGRPPSCWHTWTLYGLPLVHHSLVTSPVVNVQVHVPYRQSKLTRLLQDALGGNSQTLFLGTNYQPTPQSYGS